VSSLGPEQPRTTQAFAAYKKRITTRWIRRRIESSEMAEPMVRR
jgi:hypothetical protein